MEKGFGVERSGADHAGRNYMIGLFFEWEWSGESSILKFLGILVWGFWF